MNFFLHAKDTNLFAQLPNKCTLMKAQTKHFGQINLYILRGENCAIITVYCFFLTKDSLPIVSTFAGCALFSLTFLTHGERKIWTKKSNHFFSIKSTLQGNLNSLIRKQGWVRDSWLLHSLFLYCEVFTKNSTVVKY